MSHFSVIVIGENPEDQLAPYHEFECTGRDDQYVQDIDKTEELRSEYNSKTTVRLKTPEGTFVSPYEDEFYRDPSPEEVVKLGHGSMGIIGSGYGHGISYSSRDWGDGNGHRAKVKFIPDGYEEVEVPVCEIEDFPEWIEGWSGQKTVPFGQLPDLKGDHKYGYALLDESGNVTQVIDRTNPDKKWDWHVLGGRYADRLLMKDGLRVDQCRKGQIDMEGLQDDKLANALISWYEVQRVIRDLPEAESWDSVRSRLPIEEASTFYRDQPRVKAFGEMRDYLFDDLERFQVSKEEFLQRAKDSALSCFAILKDGQWYERGEMGWWGAVHNEKDGDKWQKQFMELFTSLPDDALISVFDCHI